MTTFATDANADLDRHEREREAWEIYAATLRELGPEAYAAAEPPAWDHLQEELVAIGATSAAPPEAFGDDAAVTPPSD